MQAQVPFWHSLQGHGNAVALIECRSDCVWSYATLSRCVQHAAEKLDLPSRCLVFLFVETNVGGIVCYLGTLAAGHALYLCPLRIDSNGSLALIDQYKPEIILWQSGAPPEILLRDYELSADIDDYHQLRRRIPSGIALHSDLALVLSTSASTASPKSVRLSLANLTVSCLQVTDALRMTPQDRALVCLPFSYVYGLSVLNSHLFAGASLVLSSGSVADAVFWNQARPYSPSSLSIVSLTLSYLRTLRMNPETFPGLRKITHSGDALDRNMFRWLYEQFMLKGVDLYPMYGQTEASGRISVLPPESLPNSFGSVGRAVKFGSLSVTDSGEVVFHGPNVMMGYAVTRQDLSLGDSMKGELRTGDIGHMDESGCLHLTGRLSRYCKVFGRRVSLDDIEAYFSNTQRVAAIGNDGRVVLFCEGSRCAIQTRVLEFATHSSLPPQCFEIREISEMPRTQSGKVAYGALAALK